jgi:phosphatidylinositol phospholipase C delta
MWDITLRKLYAIRQELMTGLGNEEIRHAIWEKQYWTASDESSDQKLRFDEVEKLCRRLNVNTSSEELKRLFKVEKIIFLAQKAHNCAASRHEVPKFS